MMEINADPSVQLYIKIKVGSFFFNFDQQGKQRIAYVAVDQTLVEPDSHPLTPRWMLM